MARAEDWEGAGNLQPGAASLVNCAGALGGSSMTLPSARAFRLRLCTGPVEGPHWLTCMAMCGWLRGIVNIPEWEMVPDGPEIEAALLGDWRISLDWIDDGRGYGKHAVTDWGNGSLTVTSWQGGVLDVSREEYEGRRNGTWKTYPSHGF